MTDGIANVAFWYQKTPPHPKLGYQDIRVAAASLRNYFNTHGITGPLRFERIRTEFPDGRTIKQIVAYRRDAP